MLRSSSEDRDGQKLNLRIEQLLLGVSPSSIFVGAFPMYTAPWLLKTPNRLPFTYSKATDLFRNDSSFLLILPPSDRIVVKVGPLNPS